MSERLTDEQLRGYASAEYSLPFAHAMADELLALRARVAQLEAALKGIEPYLDAIVCYASTMDEHEPNRLAHAVRAALPETVEA